MTYLSWQQEVFKKYQVLVLLVLLEIQLNIGITLCFKNLTSSIETVNLRACKLYREYKNVFVVSLLIPMFRIPVLLFPTLYRGASFIGKLLAPTEFVGQEFNSSTSCCVKNIFFFFKYSDFYFTSILCKLQPYDEFKSLKFNFL